MPASADGVADCSTLLIGCALAGVGGASIVILQSGAFLPNMTAGQGYIALAVVVLGRFLRAR